MYICMYICIYICIYTTDSKKFDPRTYIYVLICISTWKTYIWRTYILTQENIHLEQLKYIKIVCSFLY